MFEKAPPTPPEGKEYKWEDWRDNWGSCPDCGEDIEQEPEFDWDCWIGFCKCLPTGVGR